MTRLVEFPLRQGGTVTVEVDDGSGPQLASAVPDKAKESFEDAAAAIRPVAEAVLGTLEDLKPDRVTVELGVKFSASAGVIIARTAAEGHCKITLGWERPK